MRHRDMRVNITLLLFFIFFSFVLSNTCYNEVGEMELRHFSFGLNKGANLFNAGVILIHTMN